MRRPQNAQIPVAIFGEFIRLLPELFSNESFVPTDRECIFLSSRHFGIRRHVFARRIEPRVFADAGEPFPREIQKITTEEIVQPGCPRRFILPNVFRLRLLLSS